MICASRHANGRAPSLDWNSKSTGPSQSLPSRRSNAKAEGGNGRNSNGFGHVMKGDAGWAEHLPSCAVLAPLVPMSHRQRSPGQKLVRPFDSSTSRSGRCCAGGQHANTQKQHPTQCINELRSSKHACAHHCGQARRKPAGFLRCSPVSIT